MVSALSTSRSSSITEPDLERLADLCRRLEVEDAEESGRVPLQVTFVIANCAGPLCA